MRTVRVRIEVATDDAALAESIVEGMLAEADNDMIITYLVRSEET